MRLLVILFAIILLGWGGFETRSRSKDVSNALYGFCVLLTIMLGVVLLVGGGA